MLDKNISKSYLPLLNGLLEVTAQKVFEHSSNYLMTVPKKGFEDEFQTAKEVYDGLRSLISDIEDCKISA